MRNISQKRILEETFSSQLRDSSAESHKWLKNYHQKDPTIIHEEKIYQHLESLVKQKPTNEIIEYCRILFIEGKGNVESDIISALDKIVQSSKSEQEFKIFINRCCQILINFWYTQSPTHRGILQLVQLFDKPPLKATIIGERYKEIKKLRSLIKSFSKSKQYLSLCNLAQVMNQSHDLSIYYNHNNQPIILRDLIKRYSFLYEHCLVSEDCPIEHKKTVLNLQAKVQRRFEIDLSKYTTYRVRRSQILSSNPQAPVEKILQPIGNPTLLSDRNLNATLDHFLSSSSGSYTYPDLAQNFSNFSLHNSSFISFKDDLYEYLISSIDWEYGKNQFHNKLYKHLQGILPEVNQEKTNEFLLIRTASILLGFLIVESNIHPKHSIFFDLIHNQGTIPTIGILLKILLICPKIKPQLTKRIAILFQHYNKTNANELIWFIQFLEQLYIALVVYFGKVDLSYFKQINYLNR